MMTADSTTNSDFVNRFIALKQFRFNGQVLLKEPSGQKWIFYMYLGRIWYATGGNHPVRRWQRSLANYYPQIDFNHLIPTNISNSSSKEFKICWEYQLLHLCVEQEKITREQAAQIIGSIVAEVMFDVTQAIQVTEEMEPENPSFPQIVLLDVVQVITQVQQNWQVWQKAKIADRLPNRAPAIKQPEQLQQKVSATVYQNLTKLLNGQSTLRDLAVKMKRDVVEVTRSLLPYIQAGLVELVDIPDLAAPISSTPATPKISTPQGPLVACVDDSPAVCSSMEKILTTANYQFVAVQDSLRAIATLLSRKPDLIFLDLVMPNTNGYEICGQLRKVSAFRDTPIVILTGNDGIIDRVRAKMVGASDFLSKPVDAETVLTIAQKYLINSSPVV